MSRTLSLLSLLLSAVIHTILIHLPLSCSPLKLSAGHLHACIRPALRSGIYSRTGSTHMGNTTAAAAAAYCSIINLVSAFWTKSHFSSLLPLLRLNRIIRK